MFTKPANGWTSTSIAAKLTASDGAAADWFGASVAVDGDTVVAGAYGDDDNGDKSGSAYLFTKPANGWTSTNAAAKLTASDGTASDYFGYSVAVDGDTVVAGAYWDDGNGSDSGSAYLFTKPANGGWATATETAKLIAPDGATGDNFGVAVSVNDAPVAVDDTDLTPEDTAVDIDVVANDTDAESDTLTVTAVTTPSNGTAAVAEGSSTTVTYTPNASFTGSDSFDYTVSDGTDTDTGTVTVTVNAVPVAVDDTATTAEDTAVDINVATNDTDADGDTLSVTAVTTPSNGTAVIAEGSSITVTYTPNANFNGTDSFDYTVSDGNHTDTGTVTVTVTAVNDAPVAVDDTDVTTEDTAVVIDVVANDTDIDGDTLSVTAFTTPSNGTVIASGNATTVTYTPDAGFTGTDSFDYTVSDGTDTDTGTVTVTVTGT